MDVAGSATFDAHNTIVVAPRGGGGADGGVPAVVKLQTVPAFVSLAIVFETIFQ